MTTGKFNKSPIPLQIHPIQLQHRDDQENLHLVEVWRHLPQTLPPQPSVSHRPVTLMGKLRLGHAACLRCSRSAIQWPCLCWSLFYCICLAHRWLAVENKRPDNSNYYDRKYKNGSWKKKKKKKKHDEGVITCASL
jgi:hypothetical protein